MNSSREWFMAPSACIYCHRRTTQSNETGSVQACAGNVCVCLSDCLSAISTYIHDVARGGNNTMYTFWMDGWCVKFYPSTQQCVANYTGISTCRGAFLTFSLEFWFFCCSQCGYRYIVQSFLGVKYEEPKKNYGETQAQPHQFILRNDIRPANFKEFERNFNQWQVVILNFNRLSGWNWIGDIT